MSRKAILMLVFVLLSGLSIPVHAEEAPAVAPAPAHGCGLSFELPPAATQAGLCSATLATNPVPEPLFLGRTCRCSCGFPCKKDADCGPGGICSGGITCC
ncbi:MAG: hypothetical protein QOH06_5797 [Acidobacteriota bacterium]|jgi:hypothetical protein|nr:hypothetical protein [Acidobacteriota bacterium]